MDAPLAHTPGTSQLQPRDPRWLLSHRADFHSQSGEDGVLAQILANLPSRDHWCVEFGAWDGTHLSASRHLIEQGYSAVLIEGSKERFSQLQTLYKSNPRITTRCHFVGWTPENKLDFLLSDTPIPDDFDFLSIDIDGNDYHVWNAISHYRPKVVCIEFNPTIPTEVSFVQDRDPSVQHGSSLLALVELGKTKGYELVSVLTFNAYFVRNEFFPLFKIQDNSPSSLRDDTSQVSYFFSGYDGTVFLKGRCHLPWHNLPLDPDAFQIFPPSLRKYPSTYSRNEHRLIRWLCRPKNLLAKIARLFWLR